MPRTVQSKMPVIKWGPEANNRLLLAILSAHEIKMDYAKVAAIMSTLSPTWRDISSLIL